jgi:hypothetical protein
MGFSIQQARVPLTATDTRLDVLNALEMLLTNRASTERDRDSRHRADDYADNDSPPRRRCRPPLYTNTLAAPSLDTQVQIQQQADKLIVHASEIEVNVFNCAHAFWKERKESAGAGDGRPRWMQDGAEDEGQDRNRNGWTGETD